MYKPLITQASILIVGVPIFSDRIEGVLLQACQNQKKIENQKLKTIGEMDADICPLYGNG